VSVQVVTIVSGLSATRTLLAKTGREVNIWLGAGWQINEGMPGVLWRPPFVHHADINRRTRMANRFSRRPIRDDQSVVMVHGAQVVLIDGSAYSPPQACACDLVGAEMYPAVNTRVGDIVSDLMERGVLQNDTGQQGIR